MKTLVQRVSRASVSVDGGVVAQGDLKKDASYLANKVVNLRVFADEASHFALSSLEVRGDILVVSQFTLLADSRKGRRPSFTDAAPPDLAEELYEFFVEQVRSTGLKVETGLFREHMLVEIHNDGPVTILVESKSR